VKEPNKFHIYKNEKITRKAKWRGRIYRVVHPRLSSDALHDAFNVILWTSADICITVHDDLGWKNWTTRYILPHHWLYEWFSFAANVRRYMRRAWQSRVKEPNNTL